MVVSVDGPSGAGKTELCVMLAKMFGGGVVKAAPSPYREDIEDSISVMNDLLDRQRNELNALFQNSEYKDKGRGRVFSLFNLMRLVLIESNRQAQETDFLFIDTFWDPLWLLPSKDRNFAYNFMHNTTPAPDISVFLRVKREIAIRRAVSRSGAAELQSDAFENVDERMDNFVAWAQENIPNFHMIRAHKQISRVFSEATTIIKGASIEKKPVEHKEKPPRKTEVSKKGVSQDPWGH